MRTIKFRGLRTDGKGWVYGFYRENSFYNRLGDESFIIYTKHFIGVLDNLNPFDGIFEQVEVIPESVGQFTGLQDKNGVDIYEGDVCIWEVNGITRTASIYYDELQASFWMGKSKENGQLTLNDWMRGTHEVIGNIHENPELL